MPRTKPLVAFALFCLTLPTLASAGLNIYPADGPAPKIEIEQPKPLQYKVQKGDTVNVIAKKFSIPAKDLLAANSMSDARKLKAGQTLNIPGKTAAPAPVAAKPAAPEAKPAAAPAQVATTSPATMAPVVSDLPTKGKKGKEAVDPGVDDSKPVKGKRGKKGKELPPPPQPTITIDDKLRASFGKTGVITNATDVPQNIRDEFLQYARKWVDELDRLGVGTFTNKKIRQVGGQWEATYRVIFRESLGAEVKRVFYDHTPYVGHITYVQRVFTSAGPTKQAALQGPFTEKDEAVREIFSYSGDKKAWR